MRSLCASQPHAVGTAVYPVCLLLIACFSLLGGRSPPLLVAPTEMLSIMRNVPHWATNERVYN